MARTPFPASQQILALTIGFKQKECIAERVLPIVKVAEESFKYNEVSLKDSLQLPETKVGRKSYPNEMSTSAFEKDSSTQDHAIDDFVPNADLDKQRPGYNPRLAAASATLRVIKMRQEIRVRDLVFASANYLPEQTEDISATKFGNVATNPVKIIEDAKEQMVVTPNQVTLGQDVYSAMRSNPFVVSAVYKNSGTSGLVSLTALEDLFEMEFIVGKAIYDQNAAGQPVNRAKIWRNNLALQYVEEITNTTEATFTHGFIAHYDDVGAEIDDPKRGIKGGVTIRAGHQRHELIVCDLAGYLIQNAT